MLPVLYAGAYADDSAEPKMTQGVIVYHDDLTGESHELNWAPSGIRFSHIANHVALPLSQWATPNGESIVDVMVTRGSGKVLAATATGKLFSFIPGFYTTPDLLDLHIPGFEGFATSREGDLIVGRASNALLILDFVGPRVIAHLTESASRVFVGSACLRVEDVGGAERNYGVELDQVSEADERCVSRR
jgi:hypothetical protein